MENVSYISFPSEKSENSLTNDFNLYKILKSEEETFAKSVKKMTATNVTEGSNSFSGWQDSNENTVDSDSEEENTETVNEIIEKLGKAFISTIPKILDAVADILFET